MSNPIRRPPADRRGITRAGRAMTAGPGHPLATTTQQRLPGRQPLSARVMMFAVYACFRHGAAGVSW
jgi:hypothetical protein